MRQFSFSLFVTAMCAWATVSHAEQMLDVHGQYLFGDWQGKRTELAQKGIKFEANALTDTNYLADGGWRSQCRCKPKYRFAVLVRNTI